MKHSIHNQSKLFLSGPFESLTAVLNSFLFIILGVDWKHLFHTKTKSKKKNKKKKKKGKEKGEKKCKRKKKKWEGKIEMKQVTGKRVKHSHI